jgi:hypothetical protein
MKLVWSVAALAVLSSSPVWGSPQQELRGGKPREQKDSTTSTSTTTTTATKNDVAGRRHHRVLERQLGDKPSVVVGKLGNLGVNPAKAGEK